MYPKRCKQYGPNPRNQTFDIKLPVANQITAALMSKINIIIRVTKSSVPTLTNYEWNS